MPHENRSIVQVQVHFGAEHTSFDAGLADTVAAVKAIALTNLNVVQDPAIDYLLEFEGQTLENETETLAQLLGRHLKPHVNFHVRKRPKGGTLA